LDITPRIQTRQQPCFKVATIFKLIGSSFRPFWLARAWATIIVDLLQRDPTREGNRRGPTPITGSFTVHPLSSGIIPSYEAVSYLWGDSCDYCSFQINGQVAFVPTSPERALRGLRTPEGVRILRIDAVCMCSGRYRIKHSQNWRFESLFSEGFDFAY
jgi:hypothetical protein